MRNLFRFIILLCVVYFLGGWIAVKLGWVTRDDYITYSGIVGGLASVAGLFSLTRPAITVSDVQAIEADTLRSIAATAAELKSLQSERSKTQEALGGLEEKRKEMELMVKKASLAIFLKEQYSHRERKVIDLLEKNSELVDSLNDAIEVAGKLTALNEEIDSNPNVKQLREIIEAASRKEPTLSEAIRNLPPFTRAVVELFRSVGSVLGGAVTSRPAQETITIILTRII